MRVSVNDIELNQLILDVTKTIYFKLGKFVHLYHQGNHFSAKAVSTHKF